MALVLLAYILLPFHNIGMARAIMLYKHKTTFCAQHATLLEANEDTKAKVFSILPNRKIN